MQEEIVVAVEAAVGRAVRQAQTPWLDCENAGAYLGCAPGTLKTWRARGEGPPYHVINGKLVRYHRDELDAFVRGEVAR